MTSGRKEFSLLELNACVRNTLQESLPERYWVRAEISEARIHPSGHCYLELIEKEEQSGKTVAKARATIWATTFRLLQPWFEQSTGQLFTSGIKILIQVSISFHELYGYNLTVHDIDPAYTLGDAARRRAAILQQLREEGVADMNKELTWPILPQRIAVISSPSAAGYGDFMNQIQNNSYGYKIYTVLFPAAMQGNQTEQSIIHALDRINRHEELFDGVVIIRGAAEWIIARMHEADTYAVNLSHTVSSEVRSRIDREKQTIQRATSSLPLLIERLILGEKHKTGLLTQQIKLALRAVIDSERNKLDHTEKTVRLLSPQSLLERGYSLTLHGNRIVKSVAELSPGDTIETIFADGKTTSRIEKTEPSKTK